MLQFLSEETKNGTKCLFISADSVLLNDTSLFDVTENFVAEGGQILAIDEIHKKEDWQQHLKTIFDSFPTLKVIASGSSSLQLGKADLSRRAVKIKCFGLSFREWLNMKFHLQLTPYTPLKIRDDFDDIARAVLNQLKDKRVSVIEEFKAYLKIGYFPTSITLEPWIYFETLRESIQKTIEQDILACYPDLSGKSIQRLKKALSILSVKCPFVPDINDLTSALDLSDQKTTKQYLYALHEAHLIREVAKVGKTISALSKPEKIYLDNTNFLYALSRDEPELGTVRETFMANMLSVYYQLHKLGEIQVPKKGDFITPDGDVFEVGGRRKGFSQIVGETRAWVVADDMDFSDGHKIPLWLFGLLW